MDTEQYRIKTLLERKQNINDQRHCFVFDYFHSIKLLLPVQGLKYALQPMRTGRPAVS